MKNHYAALVTFRDAIFANRALGSRLGVDTRRTSVAFNAVHLDTLDAVQAQAVARGFTVERRPALSHVGEVLVVRLD